MSEEAKRTPERKTSNINRDSGEGQKKAKRLPEQKPSAINRDSKHAEPVTESNRKAAVKSAKKAERKSKNRKKGGSGKRGLVEW